MYVVSTYNKSVLPEKMWKVSKIVSEIMINHDTNHTVRFLNGH